MNAETISKPKSDAYMDGWGTAHRGGPRSAPSSDHGNAWLPAAWLKGFDDARAGKIDAEWALGPDLIRSVIINQKG